MAKKYFPEKNKEYTQTNRSNVIPFGNLWSTMNTDFQTNLGVMRISPRMKLNCTSPTLTNLGLPIAFKFFDNRMWAIAGTRIFKATPPFTTNAFVEDSSTSVPTTFNEFSDMDVAQQGASTAGVLVASIANSLRKKDADGSGTGTWATIGALTNSTNHKLRYFKYLNRTYVLNTINSVSSCDSTLSSVNTTGDYTLTLGVATGETLMSISCIEVSQFSIWLGTISINDSDKNNRGSLFQWDGISSAPTNQYRVNAHGIVALVIGDDDACYAMDTNGILNKCTGYGLVEVGRLPVNSGANLLNAGQALTGQFMCSNGLTFNKDGTIWANVTGVNENGDQNENFASGVYEFDLNGSCKHLTSPSMNPIGSSTITDFGQNYTDAAGAIINTSNLNIASAQQSNLLTGMTYRDAAYNAVNGIFVDNFQDDIQKKGYFVTNFWESDEAEDKWERLWPSLRKFLHEDDKVVFKYRNYEEPFDGGTITWIDTTHFSILNSSVDVSQYWTEGTGGEVEILAGVGSGSCAHIIGAVNVAGTWTVTLDEVVTGATTQTALVRFQKWIKLFPEMTLTSNPKGWGQLAIGANASRIQLKGCFTLTGPGEFYKATIFSNEDIKINN